MRKSGLARRYPRAVGQGEHEPPDHRLLEQLHVAYRDGIDDGLLVRKEPVQPADRHPRLGRDLRRGQALDGDASAEQQRSRRQHPLDGFLAAFLHRAAPGLDGFAHESFPASLMRR